MLQRIQHSRFSKILSIVLIYSLLLPLFFTPHTTYAQSGPNQTETAGFTLGSTSGMVDEFTGDFSYSIPLLDVDGYPITISYNSNVNMFQEASWVGLGWDLSVGAVSRDMRGIPDDFNGSDKIERSIGMKDYETEGKKNGGGTGIQFGGGMKVGLHATYGTYMNSYNGKGTTWDFGVNSQVNAGHITAFNWGVGFSMDSQNGVGRTNTIGMNNLSLSSQFHSRQGLQSISLGYNLTIPVIYSQKFKVDFSTTQSTTYSLGTQTSVPRYQLPRFGSNESTTVNINALLSLSAFHLYTTYTNVQYEFNDKYIYKNHTLELPSYGYFHLGKGQNDLRNNLVLMDFNRSDDDEFSEEMVNLSFSAPTYDFFNVAAYGIGGSIRGFRDEIGTLSDPKVKIDNTGKTQTHNPFIGFAIPLGVSLGYLYSQGDVTSEGYSGLWNNSSNIVYHWNNLEKDGFEERVFFKSIGEHTPRNMELWNTMLMENTISEPLEAIGEGIHSTASTTKANYLNYIGNQTIRENITATHVRPETGLKYSQKSNLNLKIKYHQPDDFTNPIITEVDRVGGIRKGHHVSALTAVSVSGINYHFDIPVYNIEQSEVVFNAAGLSQIQNFHSQGSSTGNIQYGQNDNTYLNNRGRNGFFEKTKTPPYAHSYLLSLMTSSDYLDRTGDGPSVDDIGNYYKFNYTRIYSENSPYKWRFPYEANSAKLNQGHLSTPFDDIASYTYGEKEIWYVRSIESKNYIVEFHLNDPNLEKRKDGYGVNGENGGLNVNQPLRYLKKIVLYNKNDRNQNGVNAVPIQSIEFEYDYSLCPNTPSNINTFNNNTVDSGKLTLKAIRFTGGNSIEGKLAPYEFNYENGGPFDNPEFSYIDVDRWGSYKKNNALRNNIDYPEAEQALGLANLYAQAWRLKTIKTPANGAIHVEYEADRFAYTQNKKVMKFARVLGVTRLVDLNLFGTATMTNEFVSLNNEKDPRLVVLFELDEPITGNHFEKRQKLINQYFKTESGSILTDIFFQFRVKINPSSSTSYENIIGFAELRESGNGNTLGVTTHNGVDVGYIVLKDVDIKDKSGNSSYKVNPIQKTAWQYARLHLPDVTYANCSFNWSNPQVTDCDFSNDIDAKVAFGKDLNKALNEAGFCQVFDANHSFIRLYDPRGFKFGGNARVKTITYKDNWNEMSGESDSEYKWEYQYEHIVKPVGRDPEVFHSGVAAYEPIIGKTVNPFYAWSVYANEIKQFPDETRYNVEPIAELLFPAPIVGYSKVAVKFKEIENLTQNTVGQSISEYHTARDFPTVVKRSTVNRGARVKSNNIFTSTDIRLFGFSQGYFVKTNDFHGKVKSSYILDRDDNEVQKTTYHYSLNNSVKTLNEKGELHSETIAVDYDIYADSRFVERESNMFSFGLGAIVTWIPLFVFSFSLPMDISKARTRTGFFTHTLNKHLNQSAVLERVETTYLGSKNSAENLVRDRYSGEVIVSSLNDEFNDKLYSVSYPAHWHYANLQSAYKNQNLIDGNATITNGQLTFSSAPAYDLVPGDILEISNGSTTELGWALTGGSGTFGGAIIKSNGQKFNSGSQIYSVKLHQSGRTNRITETMQTVTTKTNPIQGNNFFFPSNDILSASAVEYDYNYDIPCFVAHDDRISKPGEFEFVPGIGMKINPFRFGLGNIKLIKQLAFQSEREDEVDGIRRDAEITDYKSFYGLNSNGSWYKIYQLNHPDVTVQGDYQKWRELQKIGRFDEYGKAVSAVDPLDVKASVLYGFNKQNKLIPEAQAVNATTNQLVFESFEDHNYQQTSTAPVVAYAHFNFMERGFAGVQIVNGVRHSGENSLRIEPNRFTLVERKYELPTLCKTPVRILEGEYRPIACDCIQQFSPIPGTYVISAWFKKDLSEESYSNINVSIETPTGIVTFTPSGPIIDGWQRLEAIFEVPNQAGSIIVKLSNNSSVNMYVDDFRIHPLKSIMTTTVYNPQNLLPMATHDENNFTTFYNYDENNQLVRIRVETIEGIRTISEINRGIKKRY